MCVKEILYSLQKPLVTTVCVCVLEFVVGCKLGFIRWLEVF